MKHLHFISILFLSSFLISLFVTFFQRNEKTLYGWYTPSDWEWKTIEDSYRHSKTFKNNHPQYKGEVKREYIMFGDYIFDGQGTLSWSDGTKYEGEWDDGDWNGQGTFTRPNGKKLVGEFKDGKEWNGTEYDNKGNILYKIVNGEWNDYVILDDGGKYVGKYRNKEVWKGIFYDKDGNIKWKVVNGELINP